MEPTNLPKGTLFVPEIADLYLTLGVSALIFLGLILLAVRMGRQKNVDPRRRVLLPMLAYFGSLLALMTFLGTLWSTYKYPSVTVAKNGITIGETTYPRPSTGNMRLEAIGKGLNQEGRVLLIRTKDRKSWAFPADRYDVNRMYGLLRGEG